MDWYYSLNNQQLGPVASEKLAELVQQGAITASTLVWRQGMQNWQPYGSVAPASAPAGSQRCGECGKVFPESDMIQYEGVWVCSACKPIMLQRLQEGVAPAQRMVWRSGKKLIMNRDAILPPRCVKCNEPAEENTITRKIYWIPGAYYLLILISPIILLIVAALVRKRAEVTFCICPRHRAKYRMLNWTAAGLFLSSIGLFFGGAAMVGGNFGAILLLLGFVALLASLFVAAYGGRVVYASRIDKEMLTLKGAGPEFLAQFPEWTGGR